MTCYTEMTNLFPAEYMLRIRQPQSAGHLIRSSCVGDLPILCGQHRPKFKQEIRLSISIFLS